MPKSPGAESIAAALTDSADRLERYAERFRELAPRIERGDLQPSLGQDVKEAVTIILAQLEQAGPHLEHAKIAIEHLAELMGA